MGESLFYESSRAASAAVSPTNLESHKLSANVTARVDVAPRRWAASRRHLVVQLGLSLTGAFFDAASSSGFAADYLSRCAQANGDLSQPACQRAEGGWSLPPAGGSYWLLTVAGNGGLALTL